MQTFAIAVRALVYMTAFIWLFGWMAMRLRVFDERFDFAPPAWLRVPGALFMLAGGFLVLWCAGVFIGRGRGTPAAFDPPREFVASGPYRFVRNPMYLGGLFLLAGTGILLRLLSILLFAATLFPAFHLFVVWYEEPGLAKRFGQSYLSYKETTNRWIPKAPASLPGPQT